jgi:hypothetical protein
LLEIGDALAFDLSLAKGRDTADTLEWADLKGQLYAAQKRHDEG